MTENEKLKEAVKKFLAQRTEERLSSLNNTLPRSAEIMRSEYKLDNSTEDAVVIYEGKLRNIMLKGDIYYLGDPNGNIKELYNPTKEFDVIFQAFLEANEM